jgi:Icc-related predicted phosphoesterase
MRILAASDIHGNLPFYRGLPESAKRLDADAIVLAGDLLGFPQPFKTVEEAQLADAEDILRFLEPTGVLVFYIMGNDDFVELGSDNSRILSIHTRRIEAGDNNFVGYQYSLPFIGGIYEKSEESIREDLADIAGLVDRKTVFVTHSPAKGYLDKTVLGSEAGSRSIRDVVNSRNPLVHIHGHVHECFGRKSPHFNVATDQSMRAMLIDLDTMRHRVIYLSI